jgi:iron complex outermembrane recepter protein
MRDSLIALGLALSLHAPAYSAETDGNEGDATIIVTASTASDAAQSRIRLTPGGAHVVSHADYADRTIVSLRDTLAFSPGVYAQPRFGQEVRISIRGSGLSRGFHMRGLTLLQDGVPINLADDNGDFQELEPVFFNHLEVYRGANALRFGSGTLGGAINGVTPTGRDARGLYARLDAGSFNMARAFASFGIADRHADAWAAISADRHDGDRDHSQRQSLRFHGNVGLDLSEQIKTRFYASFNTLDQKLPGALSAVTALNAPRTGNLVGDQARDITSLRLQNRTTLDLGNATLEAGAFINWKQLYHPIFQVVDQKSADHGLFTRLDWSSGPLAITLGGESRWGTIDARRFVNINGGRGALTFNAEQTARTSTLYGELRVTPLPRLTAIIGGIYADGMRQQVQTLPAPVMGRASFSSFSPKLGLLWEPQEGIQLYGNVSRSAEFPTFVELAQIAAFVPVREQTAWTWEVGSRGRTGPLEWDISIYRADLTGEMLQYTVDASIPASTFNAGRTRHQGVELGLSINPAPWLRIRQLWQHNDFRFRADRQFANNRLPVVPRNVMRSEVRLGTATVHISPSLEWVPQGAFADYRNTARTSGYALIGLTAGATVRPGLDIFIDARNLADRRAIGDVSAAIAASPASVIYYPVEGRAAYAGVRARF